MSSTTKSATIKSPTKSAAIKSPRKNAAPAAAAAAVVAPQESSDMSDASNQDESLVSSDVSAESEPALVAAVVKEASSKKAPIAKSKGKKAVPAVPAGVVPGVDAAATTSKSRRRKNKQPYKRDVDQLWKKLQFDDDGNLLVDEHGKEIAYVSKSREVTDALVDIVSSIAYQLRAGVQEARIIDNRTTAKIRDCIFSTRQVMGVNEQSRATIDAAHGYLADYDALKANRKAAAAAAAAAGTGPKASNKKVAATKAANKKA